MREVDTNADFRRRAGIVWVASVLFVLALVLPAVRIDDGVHKPDRLLTFGSPSGWWVFWVGLLYAGFNWQFAAWLANPAFVAALLLFLGDRVRAAAWCGSAAVVLGACSWMMLRGDPERWLLPGYYVWQAAHVVLAAASWVWVGRGSQGGPARKIEAAVGCVRG